MGDKNDTSVVGTAIREFAEETGLAAYVNPHMVPWLVSTLLDIFVRHGLYTAISTNAQGFSAHVVIFDSALDFERETGLINVVRHRSNVREPTTLHKYNVHLSNETRGFTYVRLQPAPLPPLRVLSKPAAPVPGARFVESSVKPPKYGGKKVQLQLRGGVSDRALCRAIANL